VDEVVVLDFLSKWFGEYKAAFITVIAAVGIMIGLIMLCICCFILCLRKLSSRLFSAATERGPSHTDDAAGIL